MMLSVVLLSMLMILLSTLNMIRHLICSKKLKLSSEHCGLGRKWLVDFNAGKIQLASFDRSNATGAIDAKIDESVLEEQ